LPGQGVEVFCRCDRETARLRYRHRAVTRAAGHFDTDRTDDELWNDEIAELVAGGWPVIEAATNEPVDLDAVVAAIRVAGTPSGSIFA